MLSLRSVTRSAPRVIGRLSSRGFVSRQASTSPISILRAGNAFFVKSSRSGAAAFSTTTGRRAADGETDDELSAKLESEIAIENEMSASEEQPASIKDFLENSPFELVDVPGQEVVKLIRDFGDEKITISFSVADITNFDPYADEAALEEDELSEELNSNSGKQQETEQAEEDVEDFEGLDETNAPINLSIVIEKPGKAKGALNIDATAQDGAIVVENMFFYEDASVAKVDTPEAAQKRADVYPGPPFGSLDEDLQVLMERFLEERGITQTLAVFVPDYVDVKEQREYLRWLGNVKGFIDA